MDAGLDLGLSVVPVPMKVVLGVCGGEYSVPQVASPDST